MEMKVLKKDKIESFLSKLKENYELYGPKKKGFEVEWSKLNGSLLFEFKNTSLSPKSFFFPQTECMMHFKNDPRDPEGMIMKPEPELDSKRILFNIRPCDAKAFSLLDKVFMKDESSLDVYWKDKRDKTILIGLGCNNPSPTCFCLSVGCGPFNEEGLDVLAVDLGDRILFKAITKKGEEIISSLDDAEDSDVKKAEEIKKDAESKIKSKVEVENILSKEILEVYEIPLWDRIHETCLNCGACTFYCPTCHCFDIQDEVQGDYGRRVRNWDTCMSWLFTQHASGHNPRGTKKDRVRQRFMHKFKYIPFRLDGEIGCVGCGRCIVRCPVNIDVRDVVNQMNQQLK